MDDWTRLTEWWLEEADEPAYEEEVIPLFKALFPRRTGQRILDLGCGDGRIMAEVAASGAWVVGLDVNLELASRAERHGPVVVDRMPGMDALGDATFDGAYVVLALEHLDDSAALFEGTARVVGGGGHLTIVVNHPVYTAPDSGPVLDPTDGELFWRFGDYLSTGSTTEPAGDGQVEFMHRPVSQLLTEAAAAGWSLEEAREQGVGRNAARRDPLLAKHRQIPHLMALRWALHR